jgi:hypothetical protein
MPEPFPQIGMSPSVWGPIMWWTMHIVTLGYPDQPTEQDKKAAIDFFKSLEYMIPCPICKEHYKVNIAKFPVEAATGSRTDLILWVVKIHNMVNEELGKPQVSVEEFLKKLNILSDLSKITIPETASASTSSSSSSTTIPQHSLPLMTGIGLLVGVGIGAAGLYYYQKNK